MFNYNLQSYRKLTTTFPGEGRKNNEEAERNDEERAVELLLWRRGSSFFTIN